jgi:hypothetical protein
MPVFKNRIEIYIYINFKYIYIYIYIRLKENKGLSGIYRWVNNENGKSYIGSAVNLYTRFIEHFNGYKSNIILQQAFNKYGFDNSHLSERFLIENPGGITLKL